MDEALRAYTEANAWGMYWDKTGVLKPGFLADLVVLDRDLKAIPPEQIRGVRVMGTVVGGRVVYRGRRKDSQAHRRSALRLCACESLRPASASYFVQTITSPHVHRPSREAVLDRGSRSIAAGKPPPPRPCPTGMSSTVQ